VRTENRTSKVEQSWRKSDAHLLLLRRFLNPTDPKLYDRDCSTGGSTETWASVLGEHPSLAIQRFLKDGLLQPADTARVLNIRYRVADLKQLLRIRGLKVSGNKSELITRLLEHDKAEMDDLARQHGLLICVDDGKRIVKEFDERRRRDHDRDEQRLLMLLDKRDFRGAVKIAIEYEKRQVFPSVISTGPTSAEEIFTYTEQALRDIFERAPSILAGIREDVLEQLRIGAGLQSTIGGNLKYDHVLNDLETGHRLSAAAAVRMFIFHASYLRHMRQYRESGVRRVDIMGVRDKRQCPACQAIDGKVFKLQDALELPYEKCTCEDGCRCMIGEVFD